MLMFSLMFTLNVSVNVTGYQDSHSVREKKKNKSMMKKQRKRMTGASLLARPVHTLLSMYVCLCVHVWS